MRWRLSDAETCFSRFIIDSWTGAEFYSLTRECRFAGSTVLNYFEQNKQDCDHLA